MFGSKEVDDLSEINQAILHHVCLNEYDNECDGGNSSNPDDLLEQGIQSKPSLKCLDKSAASFSSVVSPLEDDDIGTSLRSIFSEDSVKSPCSRLISLSTPLKLVSALKGSREKQGLPAKKLRVTWAPDVYNPLPTSVLHTARGKKHSKKNYDKKNRKKVQKGNNYSRGGNGGGKSNKHSRRGAASLDRWYNYKPLEVGTSGNLDVFKVGSTDPYCGTSFLKTSPTTMHYSVAEAL